MLPIYKSLATPIPPLTTSAPVLVDVELVISVNCADAVTNLTELTVLENNTVVPVDDNTTLPMYKELPLKYKSLNGLDAEPRLRPDVIGTNGPPKFVCPVTVREFCSSVFPKIVAVVPTIKFLAIATPPATCKASV